MNWYDEIAKLDDQYNGMGQPIEEDNEPSKRSELFEPEAGKLVRARVRAMLDLIAWSEGTSTILDSDNGYNVLVGGTLFDSYLDHPRIVVDIPAYGIKSTAAGRYQILERYWDHYSKQLGLRTFSPENQDAYALNMFREVKCLEDIEEGRTETAIHKCASRWASFPGAGYGQHEQKLIDMLDRYAWFVQENLKRPNV